jgi:hypothetical protein
MSACRIGLPFEKIGVHEIAGAYVGVRRRDWRQHRECDDCAQQPA